MPCTNNWNYTFDLIEMMCHKALNILIYLYFNIKISLVELTHHKDPFHKGFMYS